MPQNWIPVQMNQAAQYTVTAASWPTAPWTLVSGGSTLTATAPYNSVAYQNAPPPETDPEAWYSGYTGLLRDASRPGYPYYRNRGCSQIIPGTEEKRGYALSISRGSRSTLPRVRYWQANSERRARAYQGHFFPREKVTSVRRMRPVRPTRRGQTPQHETYIPEQVNVMLPGVEFTIDPNRIY